MNNNFLKQFKGFTLIEIMIVVAIIGLLLGLGIPGFINARKNARKNNCYNNMRVIAHAIQQYSITSSLPSGSNVTIYNDLIMPSSDTRIPNIYVPNYLKCPEQDATYGGPVNNSNLNITCPVAAAGNSHGTFGNLE